MASSGYGIRWAPGEEFGTFMDESNQALGETMKAVGLAE